MSEQWAVGLYLAGIKCRVMGQMRIGIDRSGDTLQHDGGKCRAILTLVHPWLIESTAG